MSAEIESTPDLDILDLEAQRMTALWKIQRGLAEARGYEIEVAKIDLTLASLRAATSATS
jgi:hypothetical protein